MNKLRTAALMLCVLSLGAGCPMDDGDDAGDDMSSDPTFSISGAVTRLESAEPLADDDGIGTLYVGALESCELTAPLAGAGVVPMADFSSADASVEYEIADLPDGTYHLALFLDDDGNADTMAPAPDPGDLVYATGVGDGILSCIEVTIDDGDVEEVDLVLTATVPG